MTQNLCVKKKKMTEAEVNKRLNREYPKLLLATKMGSDLSQENMKAVVYKFIETLKDLEKTLDETS